MFKARIFSNDEEIFEKIKNSAINNINEMNLQEDDADDDLGRNTGFEQYFENINKLDRSVHMGEDENMQLTNGKDARKRQILTIEKIYEDHKAEEKKEHVVPQFDKVAFSKILEDTSVFTNRELTAEDSKVSQVKKTARLM